MQFRVPGLETFELELPAETKVRECLRDLGSETGADIVVLLELDRFRYDSLNSGCRFIKAM